MTLAIFLVVAAALSLVFTLGFAASRSRQLSPNPELTSQIQPIDIEAFRNLVSPTEDAYLRDHLPTSEFRHVQRERLRATAAYVQAARRNATILIRIGQNSLSSSDADTAEAARQLVDHAFLLRHNARFALCKIYVALAWPHSGLGVVSILYGYESLNGSAMLLGRLQNPAVPVRISATS
jgi:hypothetical protein